MAITDIRMPVHSSFEIARRARAIVPDVPVVLMTAFEMHPIEFEKMFPSLKVNDFLQKPFHMDQLMQVIRQYQASFGHSRNTTTGIRTR